MIEWRCKTAACEGLAAHLLKSLSNLPWVLWMDLASCNASCRKSAMLQKSFSACVPADQP